MIELVALAGAATPARLINGAKRDPFAKGNVSVAAGCRFIVTYNIKDFSGAERFGVSAITPGEFLRLLEEER